MVTLRVQQIGLIAPFGTPSWMGYILRIGDRRNPTAFRDWIWNKGGGSASLDPPYSSFQSLIIKFPDHIESNICRCYFHLLFWRLLLLCFSFSSHLKFVLFFH